MAAVNVEIGLKSHLEICLKLIDQYSWLLDSYVLDFFTNDHMSKLPKSWKEYLDSVELEDICHLLNSSQINQTSVCPLSLTCIKLLMKCLKLPRKVREKHNFSFVQSIGKQKVDVLHSDKDDSFKKAHLIYKHPKLDNSFFKHIKPKKRYEIFKMAEITAETASRLRVCCVVDIGSGLGHLSRVLAYGFNLNVCSIESQKNLTEQAEKLDCELEAAIRKQLSDVELNIFGIKKPIHMNQRIRFDLTKTDFIKDLKTAFSIDGDDFRFGIVGLHPCGDLASVLLKLHSNCSQSKFIHLIGCCYHKLTTACDSKTDIGFPLTKFCAEKCTRISYEARALACHAIESYCERLKSKDNVHLKIHCYRAALEKIIHKNWPQYVKSPLGNVKAEPNLDFNLYCQTALKKLNLVVPDKDLNSNETLQNLLKWQDVVKYYSLRLMLAPLLETAILLDRKMYLLENGISCKIEAVFDPKISPRNQLLISEKPV